MFKQAVFSLIFVCGLSHAQDIYWVGDPVSPNETLIISGRNFEEIKSVRIESIENKNLKKNVEVKFTQAGTNSINFVIPSNFVEGIYKYYIYFNNGEIVSALINAPTVYWCQQDTNFPTSQGERTSIRLFGRNIARKAGAYITLVGEDRRQSRIQLFQGSIWDGAFVYTDNLAKGRYKIFANNGEGGELATVSACILNVGESFYANQDSYINKVNLNDFGGVGDGVFDNYQAFVSAIKVLKDKGGGRLLIPEGYFRISQAIKIPSGVHIKGESTLKSSLVFDDSIYDASGVLSGAFDFSIQDLSIYALGTFDVITGGDRTIIRNVKIRNSMFSGRLSINESTSRLVDSLSAIKDGPASIRLSGEGLIVENCDILASVRSLVISKSVDAIIRNNIFYNGRRGWYSIGSGDRVIFEKNKIIGLDLEATGGSGNTLRTGLPYSKNIFFGNNDFRTLFGNDREAITTDGNGGAYFGNFLVMGKNLLEISEKISSGNNIWAGAGVFITDGFAKGCFSRVISLIDNKLLLDVEFPLAAIGEKGVLTISPVNMNYIVYKNYFEDVGPAIQFFGGVVNSVASDNKLVNSSGIFSKALYYQGVQPNWYNQILNNEIGSGGRNPARLAIWTYKSNGVYGLLNFANIARNNRLKFGAFIDVKGESDKFGLVTSVLVEGNVIEAPSKGIRLGGGLKHAIIRNNSVH